MINSSKRKKDEAEVDDDHGVQKKAKGDAEVSFKELLDFSCLDTQDAISERFERIAEEMLHKLHLVVKNGETKTRFEILELEFYLQKEESHEDPFTHGSEEQKISGRWYFHRAPRYSEDASRNLTSLTSYRSGTRKGLDLTIGRFESTSSQYFSNNNQDQANEGTSTDHPSNTATSKDASLLRGGALLRSIRRVPDKKITSGPSLLVDQILQLSKAGGIPELVEQKWSRNTSAFDSSPDTALYLESRPPAGSWLAKLPAIYRSPRIGLDLSHPGTAPSVTHPRVIFLPRPYRYFVQPALLVANGRPQTFLGTLHFCLDAGHALQSSKLRKELARLTGIKEPTIEKYINNYQAGIDEGKLEDFVGPKGKGACSSPGLYLTMMGMLDKLHSNTSQ